MTGYGKRQKECPVKSVTEELEIALDVYQYLGRH